MSALKLFRMVGPWTEELLHVSFLAFQAGQNPGQNCHMAALKLFRLVRPLKVLLHVISQVFQAGQAPAQNCYKIALKLCRLITELLHDSSLAIHAGKAPAQNYYMLALKLSMLVRPLHRIATCQLSSYPGWSGPCTILPLDNYKAFLAYQIHFVGSKAFQAGHSTSQNFLHVSSQAFQDGQVRHYIDTFQLLSFPAGQLLAIKLSRLVSPCTALSHINVHAFRLARPLQICY